MTGYRISYVIDGLHDIIPKKEDTLEVADVIFQYREKERVGTVTLESNDASDGKREALQKIDKSLSKICFAYNTEALIKKDGLYIVDLTNTPSLERVETSLMLRWGYLAQNSEVTISKIL